MEGESGFTRSIFDEHHSSDIKDQMEGEGGVTRSFIDEIHCWNIQRGQLEGESMVLLEVSLINFILRMSSEINWNLKVTLLEVSLRKFILGISK